MNEKSNIYQYNGSLQIVKWFKIDLKACNIQNSLGIDGVGLIRLVRLDTLARYV